MDLLSRAVEPTSGYGLMVQVESGFKPFLGKTYFGRWGRVRSDLVTSLGLNYLSVHRKEIYSDFPINNISKDLLKVFKAAHNYSDIKKIKFKEGNIGYSVISTMATILGESEFTTHTRNKLLPRLITQYVESYYLTKTLIQTNNIDTLLVFNGRFINENAAAAAAIEIGAKVIYYERPRLNTYIASYHSPHSINGFSLELRESLQNAKCEDVVHVANEWYQKRIKRQDPEIIQFQTGWGNDWPKFLDNIDGNLISIFPTSDDEFFGISEDWDLPENITQRNWISDFARKATSNGYLVVIRLHPNLLTKSKRLIKSWSDLEEIQGVRLIMPNSEVDSYRLIEASDLVVTCGSTIAMEAGYLGASVLSIGSGIYDDLNAVRKEVDPDIWIPILKKREFDSLKADIKACENFAFLETTREIKRIYDFKEYPGVNSPRPNFLNRVLSSVLRHRQQKQKGFKLWMNK